MEIKYQIFVSSTYNDLIEERKEVTQAILECGCIPSGMELFPASSKKQWEVIKKVIDDCDYYLLIVAGKYGSIGTDDYGNKISYTEMEFNYAIETGKKVIVLLHKNPDTLIAYQVEQNRNKIYRLKKFREKAQNGRMVKYWTNKDDLKSAAITSINSSVKNDPGTGWVKASNITLESNNVNLEIMQLQDTIKQLNLQISMLENNEIELQKANNNNAELNSELLEKDLLFLKKTTDLNNEVDNLKSQIVINEEDINELNDSKNHLSIILENTENSLKDKTNEILLLQKEIFNLNSKPKVEISKDMLNHILKTSIFNNSISEFEAVQNFIVNFTNDNNELLVNSYRILFHNCSSKEYIENKVRILNKILNYFSLSDKDKNSFFTRISQAAYLKRGQPAINFFVVTILLYLETNPIFTKSILMCQSLIFEHIQQAIDTEAKLF